MTIGHLALSCSGVRLPVRVLQSNAGFYLGTINDDGPCSRESEEYFRSAAQAEEALATGNWTQRDHP